MHPSLDPQLTNRHSTYTIVPANDPGYLFRLIDKMDEDEGIRNLVHSKFIEGDLTFLMHSGQLKMHEIIKKEHPEALIECSRQLGKSFFILLTASMHLSKLHKGRKPLVRILCETEKQIKDIVQDNLVLIQALAPDGFIKRQKSEMRYQIGLGELRLGILSAPFQDHMRGGNATLIITEEGGPNSPSDSFKSAMLKVCSPQLLRSSGSLLHVTTTSPDENHYITQVIKPKCEALGSYINLTVFDNAQLTDAQICRAYDDCYDGTEESWSLEYLCKTIRSTTLSIIPEFDETELVKVQNLPEKSHWILSIDTGGIKDKHGILLAFYDFRRAKTVIIAEALLPINTGTDVIIRESEKLEETYMTNHAVSYTRKADAQGLTVIDLRCQGFACTTPSKAAGSLEAGVNALRLACLHETIEIRPRCINLIKALKYGQFNKTRTDFARTAEMGHLDILASCMYLLRHINKANPYEKTHGKTINHGHSININNQQTNFLLNPLLGI